MVTSSKDHEAHFVLRTLVFGAILTNKIHYARHGATLENVTLSNALLTSILFMVVRKFGTPEQKLRLPNLDIEWMDVIIEKIFNGQGLFANPDPEFALTTLLESTKDKNQDHGEKLQYAMKVLAA